MIKHIPYTVIGGYLGAGKTTLLNNLLRAGTGLRLAVLVNDFGDVNIDAALVAAHDGETIALANGCICCSLADGFLTALARVRDHAERIDQIVVECSGVSDPVKIGNNGAILRYDLDGVIVVVDAEQIRTKAANKYVGETVVRQLRGADLLVLNKVDLVSAEQLAEVREWLAAVAPGARIYPTSHGGVPLAVLFGAHTAAAPTSSAPEAAHDAHERHDAMYATASVVLREPVRRENVEALAASLPDSVFRAKGLIHLADDQEHRHVFQLVGRRWTLTRGDPWGHDEPETRLVFIGTPGSIDPQAAGAILSTTGTG